ncbi:undecaprenyldiphospho-muramoylpentapeptide beta-N-acetylglucosaminyltransferase [Sulfurivermis fontis]|uniref:undecaprenyldiphospho-muramoylpentapeptide beta-N-acetylglucosaminyltransferase n=1 Tax=Sulfurivermis fontis TaxID=1972068 RepID=UPI000FDAACE2|nr:undecaprenyldiphospho-muramoylpentapeptide beta-N-acetylglucosaminyltransferase [Sulfurivermis fontis]
MSAPRILIMAGGTGGHVFPGLAVAQELRRRGAQVSWLGTRAGIEAELVPQAGIAIDYISIAGLRGKGALGWLLAPLRIVRALWQSFAVLRRREPQAVLGLGGFASGPGGLAAWLTGRPLLIHEQNAVAGLTNRLLGRVAKEVMQAFPGTFAEAPWVSTCGNPVREEIAALAAPELRYAAHQGPLRLLVVGGSLGAMALNETVPRALALLPVGQRPLVRHQTGRSHFEQVQHLYQAAGVEGELLPFIDDMAAAYDWADVVLCRAGALTVSELAAAGVAAVLVPYPHAVDDHQTRNAAFLVDAAAALLLPQHTMNAETLAALLRRFTADPDAGRTALLAMAQAARALAQPAATATVAEACLAATATRNAA